MSSAAWNPAGVPDFAQARASASGRWLSICSTMVGYSSRAWTRSTSSGGTSRRKNRAAAGSVVDDGGATLLHQQPGGAPGHRVNVPPDTCPGDEENTRPGPAIPVKGDRVPPGRSSHVRTRVCPPQPGLSGALAPTLAAWQKKVFPVTAALRESAGAV